MDKQPVFFATFISDEDDFSGVQLLIKSLRQFGGTHRNSPFWIFLTPAMKKSKVLENLGNTQQFKVEDQPFKPPYFFSTKVTAWVKAEEMARQQTRLLAWIDPCCLVLKEPSLFILDEKINAAFRPVHIRNVGQPVEQEIDGFWKSVLKQCNTPQVTDSIESFVDEQTILPYFNTHCFSIDPSFGILAKTKSNLHSLVEDTCFIGEYCSDSPHKIFLFQAVLSATLFAITSMEHIRILPPDYGYPFHLQEKISSEKRIHQMSEMTIMIYEEEQNLPLAFQQLSISPEIQGWYFSLQ